jgi:hypothetical protein
MHDRKYLFLRSDVRSRAKRLAQRKCKCCSHRSQRPQGYGYRAGKSDTPRFWRDNDGKLNCGRLPCGIDYDRSGLRLRFKFWWSMNLKGDYRNLKKWNNNLSTEISIDSGGSLLKFWDYPICFSICLVCSGVE